MPDLIDFHEIWWIFSPEPNQEWSGLRIAHFRKTANGTDIAYITGEVDRRRIGPRIWDDIKDRERWYKIRPITIPDAKEIAAVVASDTAVALDLYDVAKQVTLDAGYPWTDPRTLETHQPPKKE